MDVPICGGPEQVIYEGNEIESVGLLGFIFLLGLLTSCSPEVDPPQMQFQGATMGTVYSIKIPKLPRDIEPKKLKLNIEALLDDVNSKMSTYRNDSELSLFNGSDPNHWFNVSEDFYTVVREALIVSEKTEGAFDITIGPLVNLWGFGPDITLTERVPTETQIQEHLAHTGYDMIQLRKTPPAISKSDSKIYLDLSGLAKGYGVDLVAEYLESLGIDNYLVEIGGEVRVHGVNSEGDKWRIAIEKPSANARSVQRIISVGNAAIATSGDYRNYFENNRERFSHSIDPRTGRPITHRLASVSVVSHTAIYADAMATALMVLGPDKGLKVAEREGLAAVFIVRSTDGFIEKSTQKFIQEVGARP